MLLRLEICNFYRLTKNAPNDYTLVLVSETSKDFIRVFLEEYFAAMGVKAEIKENLTKLRVFVKPSTTQECSNRLHFSKLPVCTKLFYPSF